MNNRRNPRTPKWQHAEETRTPWFGEAGFPGPGGASPHAQR